MRSPPPQTTVTGTSTPGQQGGRVDRLPVAVEQRVQHRGQRLVHAVEPLVPQQVVDQLPGHQRLVGEQPPEQRLELPARRRRGEPAQVLRVRLGAVAGRGEQRQRRHLLRRRLRHRRDHRPAERVPHQVRPGDPERVEEPERRCRPAWPATRRRRPCPTRRARAGRARARRASSDSGCCTNSHEFLSPPNPCTSTTGSPAAPRGPASGRRSSARRPRRAAAPARRRPPAPRTRRPPGLLDHRVDVGVGHLGAAPPRPARRRPAGRPRARRRSGAAGPPTGDSSVPAILSVSMSTTSSPLAIVSPSADEPLDDLAGLHRQAPFRHRDPLDPVIGHVGSPRPVGGRLDRAGDLRRVRDEQVLQRVGERHRRVRPGDHLDRRPQRPERLLRDRRPRCRWPASSAGWTRPPRPAARCSPPTPGSCPCPAGWWCAGR